MITAKAKIKWLIAKKYIPPILKEKRKELAYHPILVFKNQYDKPIWNNNVSNVPLWSSVVFNENINGYESISTISYLVEDAPQSLIAKDAEFELYEANKKVAEGKILDLIDAHI